MFAFSARVFTMNASFVVWSPQLFYNASVIAVDISIGSVIFCYVSFHTIKFPLFLIYDRLFGLVVIVLDYRSGGPGSIPGTTRFPKKNSNGFGTGSTQPREYN
jgi:hypothetical protein